MEPQEVTVEWLIAKVGELTVLLDLEREKSAALQAALINSMSVSLNGSESHQQSFDLGV